MRSIAANALTALIFLGVLAAGAMIAALRAVEAPGPLAEPRAIVVDRGATLGRLSAQLEAEGVIRSATLFRLAARYRGKDRALRYGEYAAPAGASMAEVIDILAEGRPISYPITAPEGLTSWQIVELLRGVEVLTGEIDEIPPEGTLAPDTYSVQRGDSRAEVLERMAALQRRRVSEAWAARKPGLTLRSPEELVILASIVERETGVAAERALVAGVFHNRLARGMRLQSDPTIIYGLTEGRGTLDRPLTRGDIAKPTPWNTYAVDGLPKTAIANPGPAALAAAALPEETDALYFVADGTGGHVFARTLEEHNRNVAAWRAIERRARGAGQ